MNELLAPYRFVPLANKVLRPDWAHLVSHDHPLADGVSGALELSLTAKTPLCVGGKQVQASKDTPGQISFFRTPDNQLAIPASSIKGMLRHVMEIACFGSFKQVEDQKLGVRELVPGGNFYSEAMNPQQVRSGWLRFEQGEWLLTPCQYARVHHQEIIDAGLVGYLEWKRAKKTLQRYNLLGGLHDICFMETTPKKPVKIDPKGNKTGKLVVTGQPGNAYDEPNRKGSTKANKKYEFVFYDAELNAEKIIASSVISGFMRIYTESDEWKYWRQQLNKLTLGVPVFFHLAANGEVKSLGLSLMYKLPYKLSLHDAINNTSADHLAGQQPDLAGLIFGWLDESTQSGINNLRGRIMPGTLIAAQPVQTKIFGPTVLGTPKPTFYPAYLKQERSNKPYQTLMDGNAELAGWKRYPLKQTVHLPQFANNGAMNKKVQVSLETVNAGSVFSGTLRFHNLRLLELGALLWTLDFGQRELCHQLGLGKPLGFGQVKVNFKLTCIQANNPVMQDEPAEMLQQATVAFSQYMDHWCLQHLKPAQGWEHTPQLMSLLAVQQPALFSPASLEYYSEPKKFQEGKGKRLRLPALPDGTKTAPSRTLINVPAARPKLVEEEPQQETAAPVATPAELQPDIPSLEVPTSNGRRVPVRRHGKPDRPS